jgi:hypothetical protein
VERERDNRRIVKAIEELVKIQDDGHGSGQLQEIMDRLNDLRSSHSDHGIL